MNKAFRIGNQTAASACDFLSPFNSCMDFSLDAFEWFPDRKADFGWDLSDLDPSVTMWIRNQGEAKSIDFSVHLNNDFDIFNADYQQQFQTDLEFAKAINASKIIIHFQKKREISDYFERLDQLLKIAEINCITILIENTVQTGPEDFNKLFRTIHDNSKTLCTALTGMCFDTGHANIWTQNHFPDFLQALAPEVEIKHIHLHRNDGYNDLHQTLTDSAGTFNNMLTEFFSELLQRNFSGNVILEHWPDDASELLAEVKLVKSIYLT